MSTVGLLCWPGQRGKEDIDACVGSINKIRIATMLDTIFTDATEPAALLHPLHPAVARVPWAKTLRTPPHTCGHIIHAVGRGPRTKRPGRPIRLHPGCPAVDRTECPGTNNFLRR